VILPLLLALQDPLAVRADTLHPVHDALHYSIRVVIPDTGSIIEGETETTWRVGSPAPIRLQLDTALKVSRAAWAGERRLLRGEWRREGDLIEFPHTRSRGDSVVTRLEFRGRVRDGLIIGRNPYGARTAFADNWPDRAHHWFPAQDHPSDKATATFDVEVPRGWRVIAGGTLERADTLRGTAAHGRSRWRYRLAQPVPVYNMVIGAGPLTVTRIPDRGCSARCVPVTVWSYPEDSAYAVAGPFRRSAEILQYFTTLIGPFPYPGLAHVESSTIFGGAENAGAIFYGDRLYHDRRLSERVVAHETAHQWFGDAVTEADWHHLWLSEGFATYFAALWQGHVAGDSALRQTMAEAAASVFDIRDSTSSRPNPVTERPILDSAATDLMGLLNTNNYPRGAWVLHQLRGLVGDSAFFRGIRAYYTRYRDGNALSSDFAAAMSAAAGRDLGWYFMQSLRQPGYPVLEVRWTYGAAGLSIVIRQVQKPEWGVYTLPALELSVDGHLEQVDVSERETRLFLPAYARAPAAIEVDPHRWWLLKATVTNAP
jgi:aminopeptidase N